MSGMRNITGAQRTSWNAAQLLKAGFPEPRCAVPGIVAEGLTLLVGPPKLGKGWFAMGLAVAVAHGGQALGRIPVDAGTALYLALEDPPRRLQRRLRLMLDGGLPTIGLQFETTWPKFTKEEQGVELLADWMEARPDTRLIVVDVFARVRAPMERNGNAYSADYNAVAPLKQLADSYDVAVLLVHHTRKQDADDFVDTVSGTSGLAGAADAVLALRRARGAPGAELLVTGRDVEESTHALRFDPTRGAWLLSDTPAGVTENRAELLELLRRHGAMFPKEVAEAIGWPRDRAKQTLKRMADAGQLNRVPGGRYWVPADPLSPPSPLSPDGARLGDSGDACTPGDTGDRGDTTLSPLSLEEEERWSHYLHQGSEQ
jgi:hypothetical protein